MDQICQVAIEGNNFTNNLAVEGGAVHYDLYRPTMDTSNIFTNNKADYGPDIASYPAYLEFPESSLLTGIASGQQILTPFRFRILDFDHQVMKIDNTSALIINADEPTLAVTGENQKIATSGEFLFDALILTGGPSKTQEFTVSANFINSEQVRTALKDTSSPNATHTTYPLRVEFRQCNPGETMFDNK